MSAGQTFAHILVDDRGVYRLRVGRGVADICQLVGVVTRLDAEVVGFHHLIHVWEPEPESPAREHRRKGLAFLRRVDRNGHARWHVAAHHVERQGACLRLSLLVVRRGDDRLRGGYDRMQLQFLFSQCPAGAGVRSQVRQGGMPRRCECVPPWCVRGGALLVQVCAPWSVK